jgi:glycerate kinase
MKVLIAPNAFKESISAMEAAHAIAKGLREVLPDADLILKPFADGGNDTVHVVAEATAGTVKTFKVHDPLNRPVQAAMCFIEGGTTAVIETAQCSGLHLVPEGERDPWSSHTIGTGELIVRALDAGCSKIIIGLGGSATVDCGFGMATTIGFRFLDSQGCSLAPLPENMHAVTKIDCSGMDHRIRDIACICACDVSNPLFGRQGGLRTYGPQKGIQPDEIARLEDAAVHFFEIVNRDLGVCPATRAGAGAAGGLGAGCSAFLSARLLSGADLILDLISMDRSIDESDLVITGEGALDENTVHGKGIFALAKRTGSRGVPLIAFVGAVEGTVHSLYEYGLTAVFPINRRTGYADLPLKETGDNLAFTAANIARLVTAFLRDR